MGVDSDGEEEKKLEAIKNPDAGMDVDNVVKEDGAAAVAGGGQEAAAHTPVAEGAPQDAPNELPPNAEDEMEGWTLVKKKKNGADRWRVSLMVRGGPAQQADKLAKFLFNCATHAVMRRLPNAANHAGGQQVHRYAYIDLKLGGKERPRLNLGMVASDQKGWVETPLGSDFFPLQYQGPRRRFRWCWSRARS